MYTSTQPQYCRYLINNPDTTTVDGTIDYNQLIVPNTYKLKLIIVPIS